MLNARVTARVTALVTLEGLMRRDKLSVSAHVMGGGGDCLPGCPSCPIYDPHFVMLLGRACAPAQVVSVQYQVVDSQAFDDGYNDSSLKLAFYKLTNPHRQITSCVHGPC